MIYSLPPYSNYSKQEQQVNCDVYDPVCDGTLMLDRINIIIFSIRLADKAQYALPDWKRGTAIHPFLTLLNIFLLPWL
mgnify:CR=1 FL=1